MKDKRKGFTLIELLAVLVLLILVFSIALVAFTSYQESSKKSISKIEKTEILNSATAYFKEFENSDDFIVYKDKSSNSSYSCISVLSLIQMGYYDESVEFKASGVDKGTAVVRITKDSNGVVTYSLIDNIKKDAETEALCKGFSFSGTLLDDSTNIEVGDDNSDVKLAVGVKKRAGNDNSYLLTLKLNADVIKEYVSPVYVLVMLDVSGSMQGNAYNNAVKAIKSMSNTLINNIDDSKIALYTFAGDVVKERDFKHAVLTDGNFSGLRGYTNILDSLDTSNNAIRAVPSTDPPSVKYVLYLTDGDPNVTRSYTKNKKCDNKSYNSYSYDKNTCYSAIKESAANIRNSGATFVFVEYKSQLNSADLLAIYKEIGSDDPTGTKCPGSSINNKCYYSSNSNTVSSLFNNLAKIIINNVQTVKTGEVVIGINSNLDLLDSNGNQIGNNLVDKKITFDEKGMTIYEFTYILNIDPKKVDCGNKDTCMIDLFNNNAYIDLVYSDGTSKKLKINSSPKIQITKSNIDYTN